MNVLKNKLTNSFNTKKKYFLCFVIKQCFLTLLIIFQHYYYYAKYSNILNTVVFFLILYSLWSIMNSHWILLLVGLTWLKKIQFQDSIYLQVRNWNVIFLTKLPLWESQKLINSILHTEIYMTDKKMKKNNFFNDP